MKGHLVPEQSTTLTGPVMTEAEFDLAQDGFMHTVDAAGWPGMNREEFVVYLAIPYMRVVKYADEAKRLVVHYLCILKGKETIEDEMIKAAEEHFSAYRTSQNRDDGYEADFYPEF